MFYGYNPTYFLSFAVFVISPLESFSTRIVRSLWDGSTPRLESLFYRIESSYGFDWPYS